MGITGLLPALKSIMHKANLSEYSGLRAGIDAYSWLHRGAHCCLMELALGHETDKYVKYCMDRVQLLLRHGITPIVVFDGARPPIKKEKNVERRRAREEAREKGLLLYQEGKTTEAHNAFKKAVAVTDHMARKFIKELKAAGVRFVVAPYEADAQLAYMSIHGVVDFVITEDGDSIPFGCRKVLFKLDKDGTGDEFDVRNLGANEELSFRGWNNNMFLDMCLLAGCDYLVSIPGLGLKTAYKLVKQHRHCKKILRELRYLTNAQLPDDYEESFAKARLAFRHHLVYDMEKQAVVPLNPFKAEHLQMDVSFIGKQVPPDIAQGVAFGKLHPTMHRPYSPDEEEGKGPPGQEDDDDEEDERPDDRPPVTATALAAAAGNPESESVRRHEVMRPAWAGLGGDSPEDYVASRQRLGSAPLYTRKTGVEDAKRAAHMQSVRSVDLAVRSGLTSAGRVATADTSSARLPLELVVGSVKRPVRPLGDPQPPRPSSSPAQERKNPSAAARASSTTAVPPQATRAPSVPVGVSPAAGVEEENDEEDVDEEEPRPMIPKRSSFFPACSEETSRIQNARDAYAALQRMEEMERSKREEAAAQRQLKRKGPVSFAAPLMGIDFQSPVVSEQVETLYRRKKRIRDAGPMAEAGSSPPKEVDPIAPASQSARPLRPQDNRSPSRGPCLTHFVAGSQQAQKLERREHHHSAPSSSRHEEYVPLFATAPPEPEVHRYEPTAGRHRHWSEEQQQGVGFFSRQTITDRPPVAEDQRIAAPPPPRSNGVSIFQLYSFAPGQLDHNGVQQGPRISTLVPHQRHQVNAPTGVGLFAPSFSCTNTSPPEERTSGWQESGGIGFFRGQQS